MARNSVLVVGIGEIGGALREVLGAHYEVFAKDVEQLELAEPVQVMHVCYPYQVLDFVGTTCDYIAQYRPQLTVIHSTVLPGTTHGVEDRSGQAVAYSPVRGKHVSMARDLRRFTKFVAASSPDVAREAMEHLRDGGMPTEDFGVPEALELAKLVETTYLGVLIAWAQETERYAREVGAEYLQVMRFTEGIDYLPPVVFRPGFIGGHCVMPNIDLLEGVRSSPLLEAIRWSNAQKAEERQRQALPLEERLTPLPKR